MRKRDIRNSEWFDEVADYFLIDPLVLKKAVANKRMSVEKEPQSLKNARNAIRKQFMSEKAIALHEKILNESPEAITDLERSSSWKEYIFVCVNSERRSFQRMFFYEMLIRSIIIPKLEEKKYISVVDYGCGSSLFTRIITQDFPEQVLVTSVDVGKHAVNFSLERNRLFNSKAKGILIDDVNACLDLSDVDLIFAYTVFEHLPNSTKQIEALIDALCKGGVLIENYSGHSQEVPHKSDTFDAYKSRDRNLDLLKDNLELLFGRLPEKDKNGIYGRDIGDRFWVKKGINPDTKRKIKKNLARSHSVFKRGIRRISRKFLRC